MIPTLASALRCACRGALDFTFEIGIDGSFVEGCFEGGFLRGVYDIADCYCVCF